MARPKTLLADQLKPLARTLKAAKARPVGQPAKPVVEDEAALFRKAVADVQPLKHPLPFLHPSPAASPWPQQHLHDEGLVMHDAMTDFWPWDEIESGEELLYLRSGQKLDTMKKLRRGHWVVQGHLDLHGLNTDEARAAVGAFVHDCVQQDRRCVRIVHGKGLGSRNKEPVLKNKLRNWLVQREEVQAFCQARQVDGGAGAVIVLLRGRKR
ncbi:DNA mismatch repair protein MutS [Chitinimonas prasina]|uniref:DNA mismatch repair protein MutS n=1 Tax=Chitinimonas prasina TaxID=1434937 RepID=A0ABQ5YIG7_9NEIS|nr:Smr/MutS family protein [Chitinimonas prasina]GLR14302.1 DNA mismatch repair protein MutS [Chitinimonas prasina]